MSEVDVVNTLWKPALYIQKINSMNIKKAFEEILALNIIRASPTKQIIMMYSEIEITLACSMSFTHFPFDEQICDLNIMDRRMTAVKELQMETKAAVFGSMFSSFEPTVREFEYSIHPPVLTQLYIQEAGKNVSNTGFQLKMKRNYSKYYIMYYIPTSKTLSIQLN